MAIALIVGALVIFAVEHWYKRHGAPRVTSVDEMTWMDALKVGLAQCFSLIPGTSRSGATIMGGMLFGLSRQVATEFSFFLAVPIMFAATGYQLVKYRALLTADDLGVFAVGFVVSFVAALVAVKALIRYVAHHDFNAFAWYRIALGAVVLWYFRAEPSAGDAAVLRRVALDERQELVFLVGLAHVLVHAELDRVVAVLVRRARGDHDDRDRARARVGAHVAREFEAVHARHLDVEQDAVGLDVLQLLQRVDAVLRRGDLVALARQHAAR